MRDWCGLCGRIIERMTYLFLFGFRYWDHAKTTAVAWVPPRDRCILPSDSTMRSDRAAMLAGDFELANKEKIRLEQVQRSDRKIRKESGKASN